MCSRPLPISGRLACEQRDVKANPRPVFWFVDEAHELVCNYTPEFLATARSARVASVLISQNKPNYLAAMGGEAGQAPRRCVPGQHGHEDIPRERRPGNQQMGVRHDLGGDADAHQLARHDARTDRAGAAASEAPGRKVLPSEFTTLKKGGPQNGFITDCHRLSDRRELPRQ